MKNMFTGLLSVLILITSNSAFTMEEFSLGIMQDKKGVAAKFHPLISYFKKAGVELKLKGYKSYPDAANKFFDGDVDGMFAGSGVAGSMMIKDVAYPLLRPLHNAGWSTYWAVVLAPVGGEPFDGKPEWFDGKSITCSSLASSGEFFARSILGSDRELVKAGSHGMAIQALARGKADVAIVKNRVWDSMKGKFPTIEQIGKDQGENPDGTLIVSHKASKGTVEKVKALLLGLEKDSSPEALIVKKVLKINGYIPTSKDDFAHTLALLRSAGVTPAFEFRY